MIELAFMFALAVVGIVTIAKLGTNPARYWEELVHDAYHRERGQAPITPHGPLAERLGLTADKLTEQQFENVFDGYTSDRTKRLVHSTVKRHRGLDTVFTISKGLSAWAALCSPKDRERFIHAIDGAAAATMEFAFRELAVTRRGAGGAFEERVAEWIYFTAVHISGRLGQPHVHAHVLIPNLCMRRDGTTGTIDLTRSFFDNSKLIDTVFQAEVRARLTRDLGLRLEHGKHGPTLATPPTIEEPFKKLIEKWSPGSRAIRDHLGTKGVKKTPRSTTIAQKQIRPPKNVVSYDELYGRWREEALAHGITVEKLTPKLGLDPPHALRQPADQQDPPSELTAKQERHALSPLLEPTPHELTRSGPEATTPTDPAHEREQPLTLQERIALTKVFKEAAAQLTAKKNFFSEHTFISRAVGLAHEIHAPTHEVLSAAREYLRDPEQTVALGGNGRNQDFFTTPERWQEEQRLIELARKASDKPAEPLASPHSAEAMSLAASREALGERGREALFRIVTGDAPLSVLDGGPGPERDPVIRAIARVARERGFQVVAAAATSRDAIELERRTGIRTQTANQWLLDYARREWEPPRDRMREILEAMFGPRLKPDAAIGHALESATRNASEFIVGKPGALILSSKTLLVFHEAQRLPVRALADLLDLTDLTGGRALIVGDSSGLPALTHAGGFSALTDILPHAQLPAAGQSRWPVLHSAQDAFAAGEYGRAMNMLAAEGHLIVRDDETETIHQLIADWASDGGTKRPERNLIITSTHEERRRANALAQRARWRSLRIAPLHFLTVGGKGDRTRIHQSDRVVFTHGLRVKDWIFTRRIRPGEFGTVEHVDIVRRRLTVKTERGVRVTFDPKRYPDIIELGYALTMSRAAALRPENVYALMGCDSHHSIRAKLFSAAKELTLYFTKISDAGQPIMADLVRLAAKREEDRLASSLAQELSSAHQRQETRRQLLIEQARKLGH